MKELKDFLQAITDNSDGNFISVEDAKRIVSEAYIAGINFEAAQQHGIQQGKKPNA